jgi:hypothetical protein
MSAMRILTATAIGQGIRDNNFDWTIEGELVSVGLVCARDRKDPDGGCGCGRAFIEPRLDYVTPWGVHLPRPA